MGELQDLYQELILEHSKNPRNYRVLDPASHQAEGYNPLCGDHYTVYLNVEGGMIREITFQGSGCAISKSSASIMSQMLKGKTTEQAESLYAEFHNIVTGKSNSDAKDIGKLDVFSGVAGFPTRIKCAILAWHTLRAALRGEQVASSE